MLLVESLQRLSGEVLQGRIGTDIDGEPRSRDPRSEDADGDRHGHFGVGFTVACEICWGEWLFGFPCFWHVRCSWGRGPWAYGEARLPLVRVSEIGRASCREKVRVVGER